jgi:hypothetical protein
LRNNPLRFEQGLSGIQISCSTPTDSKVGNQGSTEILRQGDKKKESSANVCASIRQNDLFVKEKVKALEDFGFGSCTDADCRVARKEAI